MAVITEDAIRELAAFRGEEAPVTTCYLDVDGRRFVRRQDYERELEYLLRRARDKSDGCESVVADVRRIEDYVKAGIDRSTTRGLAFFACSAHDLWRVVPLPVPVRNHVVVNAAPAVGQLESVVEGRERFGVLLVDRQRARMFVFELGQLTDHSELYEQLPRDYDDRGHSDAGYEREQHHVDELTSQHVRHAAKVAFEVYQRVGFDGFTVAGPEPVVAELEGYLHPYLRERFAGRFGVSVTSSLEEIRNAALEAEAAAKRQRDAQLVEKLRGALGPSQRGVAGLDAVLRALQERRIEHLLVSSGFAAPGWWCRPCGALATVGRTCPFCAAPDMTHVDDAVEEAIEHALAQGVKVHVCDGNADLDVLGRIAGLLRY